MTPARSWAALQRAAAFPPHGQARRKRDELRRFTHSMLAAEIGLGPRLLWWPIGKPLPEGASLARQSPTHHSHYSQLIVVGNAWSR